MQNCAEIIFVQAVLQRNDEHMQKQDRTDKILKSSETWSHVSIAAFAPRIHTSVSSLKTGPSQQGRTRSSHWATGTSTWRFLFLGACHFY